MTLTPYEIVDRIRGQDIHLGPVQRPQSCGRVRPWARVEGCEGRLEGGERRGEGCERRGGVGAGVWHRGSYGESSSLSRAKSWNNGE